MNDRICLQGEALVCEVDRATGDIVSIRLRDDGLETEYAANTTNLLYPQMKDHREWLGEWLFRIWDHETRTWIPERTCAAARRVETLTDGVRVVFSTTDTEQNALRRLAVAETYRMDGADLTWEMQVQNVSGETLDVGEVSMALMTNTDFNSIFEQLHQDIPYHWHGPKQRDWHEKRVFQHLHLAGSNSYAFLQRPRGDFPALLFHPEKGTYVDTAYQMTPGL